MTESAKEASEEEDEESTRNGGDRVLYSGVVPFWRGGEGDKDEKEKEETETDRERRKGEGEDEETNGWRAGFRCSTLH